jgi:hypothetical protein
MDSDAPPPVAVAHASVPYSSLTHSLTHSYTWSSRPTASNKPISAVISYDLLLVVSIESAANPLLLEQHMCPRVSETCTGKNSYIWIHHSLTVFRNLLLFSR